MTLASLLHWAASRLCGRSPSPRFDAELLLAHLLGKDRLFLYAHPETEVPSEIEATFRRWIERRREGYPVAYLLGKKAFYGRDFLVAEGVLIPRPETELLVERALAKIPPQKPLRTIDVGCGSGAIAITLALERPKSLVTATDLSPKALAITRCNREQLGARNVTLMQARWLEPFRHASVDLIVSNPPYIAEGDPHLAGEIRFEPKEALVAGSTGLEAYATLILQAKQALKEGGWLILEHGFDQKEAVARLLEKHGFREIACFHDLQGHPRVTEALKSDR